MRRLSNCCWWTVAAVAVVGLVLAPLSARADLPDTVTYDGKVYKVIKPSGVKKVDKEAIQWKPAATTGTTQETPTLRSAPRMPLQEESQANGLRETLATYVFYQQNQSLYYASDAWNWANDYTLANIPPSGAAAVTEISFGGLVNASSTASFTDACMLFEIYDTFTDLADPLHANYLGGAILYYGSLAPSEQTGDLTYLATDAGLPYFFQVSNDGDNVVFVVAYTGTIVGGTGGVGGTFVPSAANGGIVTTFGYRAAHRPTIGTTNRAFFSDTVGNDRIYNGSTDGRFWYGDESYLQLVLAGEVYTDCNGDNVIDSKQVECGLSLGSPACETGTCAYFKTGGQFQDPLGVGWVVSAACDDIPPGGNGIPDECDIADCNNNGVPDGTDIANATSQDCNGNTVPDECEIDENSTAPGGPFFCTADCDPDCNNDGIPDDCQLATAGVCDTGAGICDDGVTSCTSDPDCPPISNDCDRNFVPDDCQIAAGASDCDADGVLDICQYNTTDCNGNGVIDQCDILSGYASDGNGNGIPDSCDFFSFVWIIWNEFTTEEGYTLGPIEGQPVAEPDPIMRWSTTDSTAIFDLVAWPDLCNSNGYSLKIQGTSDPDRVTSPLYGLPANIDEDFNWQVLSFNYMVTNGLTGNATQVFVQTDQGAEVTGLEFGIWDFDDTGTSPDPRPTVIVFDADGGYVITPDPLYPESFTWTPGECESMDIWLFNDSGSVDPPYLGFSFGNDPVIWIFGATSGGRYMGRFENTLNWTPTWSGGTLGQVHDFYLDNVRLFVIGPDAPFSDCNGNGIADEIDIAEGGEDCNGNGILDACDVLAGERDCDLNDVLDECDINNNGGTGGVGGTLDGNANGTLDFCEPDVVYASTIGFETIEGFVVNDPIAGQLGWWGGTFGTPAADVNVVFQGGSNQVKFDPNAAGGFASVFGSPLYVGEDPDITQWNFQVTFGSGASYAGDPLWVDLTDFYDPIYGGAAPSPNFILDGPTTGLVFRRTGEDPLFVYSIYTYNATGGEFDTGLTWGFNQTLKFRVKAINTQKHVEITKIGSPPVVVDWASGSPLQSGARHVRHIAFTTNPPTVEKLIDNVYRKDGPDCDYDGVPDSRAIASGAVADLNADGIPDRCQDCDADCTWISGKPSLGPTNTACLDPREIALGTALDTNLNGIPDECDIDIAGALPDIGWKTHIQNIGGNDLTCEEVFSLTGFDPAEECYVTRYGGGGWSDCDNFGAGNGVLDSIDICGTSDPDCTANTLEDCNGNGFADGCDIVSAGQSSGVYVLDQDGDGKLDSCVDCNGNGTADYDDVNISGLSTDVIVNETGAAGSDGIPDECCVKFCGISDLNCDLNSDLLDYAFQQECAGPVAGGGPLCGCADMDGNGVVDGDDVVLLGFFLYGPL